MKKTIVILMMLLFAGAAFAQEGTETEPGFLSLIQQLLTPGFVVPITGTNFDCEFVKEAPVNDQNQDGFFEVRCVTRDACIFRLFNNGVKFDEEEMLKGYSSFLELGNRDPSGLVYKAWGCDDTGESTFLKDLGDPVCFPDGIRLCKSIEGFVSGGRFLCDSSQVFVCGEACVEDQCQGGQIPEDIGWCLLETGDNAICIEGRASICGIDNTFYTDENKCEFDANLIREQRGIDNQYRILCDSGTCTCSVNSQGIYEDLRECTDEANRQSQKLGGGTTSTCTKAPLTLNELRQSTDTQVRAAWCDDSDECCPREGFSSICLSNAHIKSRVRDADTLWVLEKDGLCIAQSNTPSLLSENNLCIPPIIAIGSLVPFGDPCLVGYVMIIILVAIIIGFARGKK